MKYFVLFLFVVFSFTGHGIFPGTVEPVDYDNRSPNLSTLSDKEFKEVIIYQKETIKDTFEKLFKNLDECETSAQRGRQSPINWLFGKKYHATRAVRVCVQDRVEKATTSLCTAKAQVYEEKERIYAEQWGYGIYADERNKYGNLDARAERTRAAIQRMDKLHNDYRRVLISGIKKFKGCGKGSNELVSDECEALRDILLSETTVEC